MKSTITITPVSNIDFGKMEVIDNNKVSVETHDSDMDVFEFYNKATGRSRKANLMDVSIYNDFIVRDQHYKILNMLSK